MALTWGTLHDIKIDNMADQHRQVVIPTPAKQPLAVITVADGEGFAAMMKKMGAQMVIAGGQTMNPPVEDFMSAVHQGQAERYIILPNNKNIILAANQAKKLLGDRVEVVPTVNIPQGLAALLAFDSNKAIGDNVSAMTSRIETVRAAGVTVAVRDSLVDGQLVPAGRFIGVVNSRVLTDGADLQTALFKLAEKLLITEAEVVSLYYGSELAVGEAEKLAALLQEKYNGVEVELYAGGQSLYPLLISIE
jgi:dihydroxyacetone kinase-like predicted kinase